MNPPYNLNKCYKLELYRVSLNPTVISHINLKTTCAYQSSTICNRASFFHPLFFLIE